MMLIDNSFNITLTILLLCFDILSDQITIPHHFAIFWIVVVAVRFILELWNSVLSTLGSFVELGVNF